MKVSLGINKKAGMPNYGSVGALCTIDLDLDDSLLTSNPNEVGKRIANAYDLARQSVEDELNHHRANNGAGQSQQPNQSYSNSNQSSYQGQEKKDYYRNNNGNSNNGGGDNSNAGQGKSFIASPKQISYIFSLSKGVQGMDTRKLERYTSQKFGKGVNQLSPKEASLLIQELLNAKNNGGQMA